MANLPEEDQADIRPHSVPELRAREGMGKRRRGEHSGSGSTARSRARGDHGDGLYNPKGDDGGGKTSSPSEIGDAEDEAAGLYNSEGSNKGGLRRGFFKYRKRAAIGGGIAGVGVTGIVLLASITQGPLQLVHLSEILQKNFFGSNEVSKVRLRDIYRYYTGNVGATRVSFLGRQVVGRTIKQLSDIGIEFQTDGLGQVKSAKIDTGKLKQVYPELEGMSDAERISFLKDTFPSLSDVNMQQIRGGPNGTKVAVNTRDFGIDATRALTKDSLAALDDGKIITGIKFRVMAKFYNLPSLFHPLERVKAAGEKTATTNIERASRQAETERQANLEKPAATEVEPVEASFKDKLSGQNIAGGALLLTAGMCLVRSVADDVVAINRGAIVVPAAIQATDKTAVGEQVKSGQDISASQAGGVADSFIDKNGKTIWQGQALQATEGVAQSGEDLPYDYKQAFSNDTTAQHIKDTIGSPTIAGHDLGGIACSTPGIIIQGIAGIALAVSSVIAAAPTGGASLALEVGKVGAGAAAVAGATYFIQQEGANILSDKAVFPAVMSGPVGGNLLAYGGREAANIGARASGAVPLSNTDTALLDKQQQAEDLRSFRSESLFARMFDTKDYRSLTGRFADSLSPSFSQNVASATTGVLNIWSSFPRNLSSIFIPKTQADNQSYNWGFSKAGMPSEVLNDPNLQNPYDNADKVAAILDAGDPNGYIDKAKKCFGVDISKGQDGWDALPKEAVNPNSDDYVNAHCGDLSDYNWRRVMLFVSDSQTMEATACYSGDDQSCSDLGYNDGAATQSASTTASTPSTGNLPTGSAKDLASQLVPYVKDGKIQCVYSSGCPDIVNTANGKSIKTGPCLVDSLQPGLVGLLLGLAQEGHSFILSALCTDHSTADGLTEHQGGRAADFNTIDGVFMGPSPTAAWSKEKIDAGLKLDQDALDLVGRKNIEYGQIQCHKIFSFQSDPPDYHDLCHHQHISVQSN